jgi:hypothetical protein
MISESVRNIRLRVAQACARAGRNAQDVTILAVSKTFSESRIAESVEAGILDIGENYVQELLRKKRSLDDGRIRWHFVGHLQSNKVRHIAQWVHLIHTVDSVDLAREIDKRARIVSRVIDVLIEVNTTGEASKFGVTPDDTLALVKEVAGFDHLRVAGLMTMGPFLEDPEGSRPMYRLLRDLKEQAGQLGQANVSMRHLSMGMSGDFEVGVEEGATIIRLGTAIFGPRKKKA